MRDAPDLHLLFATNFSEACHRTGAAIGQLAGRCRLTLTIVHAVGPDDPVRQRQRELGGFMAGVDRDIDCRRLIVEGRDPAGDVAALCATRRFDLVMAPGSKRRGWHGLLARSFRSRLLRQCSVPLWTASACLPSTDFSRPIGTVSCLLDFDDDPAAFFRLVSTFSQRVGARLRVLAVIPPVDDGTLADVLSSDAPLTPARAVDRIQELCAGHEPPSIDVAVGDRGREVRRMIGRHTTDLLFVGRRHAAEPWFFPRTLDRLPCPVVCVGGSPAGFTRWSFQDEPDALRYPSLDGAVIVGG
jgi:hypothetical protein